MKRTALEKIDLENYKKCLTTGESEYGKMTLFRSIGHTINTYQITKKILDNKDDKRFIESNKCSTLAYFHHKLIERELLTNIRFLEAESFTWGRQIGELESNFIHSIQENTLLKSLKTKIENAEKTLFYATLELEMFYNEQCQPIQSKK